MSLAETLTDIRARADWAALPRALPFARMLGLRVEVRGESFTCVMPFEQKLIGNPALPALHGGAIGGYMECTGILHLLWSSEALAVPKTIDFTIDYLLSGRPQDTYANVYPIKLGKRVSNLRIEAWQTAPAKPIAVAVMNMLMR